MIEHYYNEHDPYCAEWLQNLMNAGHIRHGLIDTRSIKDVKPDDLIGFTQCHFFAGIGGWSLAAKIARWPDDRPLWTGSAPCQPFSNAGKGEAQSDDRHLWPDLFQLIKARGPDVFVGEQVAAAVGKHWLDGVLFDMESIDYAGGAVIVPACAVNAPHRRDRLWFACTRYGALDNRDQSRLEGFSGYGGTAQGWPKPDRSTTKTGRGISDGALANTGGRRFSESREGEIQQSGGTETISASDAMEHTDQLGASGGELQRSGQQCRASGNQGSNPGDVANTAIRTDQPRIAWPNIGHLQGSDGENNPWGGALWLVGYDGKARRIGARIRELDDGVHAGMAGVCAGNDAEETTCTQENQIEIIPLLAHGVKARTGKLRALGNAIVPYEGAQVLGALMDVTECG